MRKLFLIFVLASIFASCAKNSGLTPWSQIQDDNCLFYIQDPSGARELWFWCEGQEPNVFLKGFDGIQDYTAAGGASAIYFIQRTNSTSASVWVSDNPKKTPQRLMDCSNSLCADIAINTTSGILAFSDFEDEPRLKLFDLELREMKNLLFNATDLEFSPDGKYLGFFDRNTNQLVILNVLSGEVITVDSQEGLTGGWSSDSQQFLYGAMTFQDETPGVNVFSLNIQNGLSELLNADTGNFIEYYQPRFFKSTENLIAAVRDPSIGFNKQLWVVNREGNLVTQITSDFLFDHSAFQLDRKQARILFQRFSSGTPNSQPEIWMIDLESNELMLVARNATNPQWVFSN
jgi:hypothetical protein